MHTSSNFIPPFNPHSPLYRNPHIICRGLVPQARFEIALEIFWLQIISQARRLEPVDKSIAATLKAADQLPPAEQSHRPCPLAPVPLRHQGCRITQTHRSCCNCLALCSAPGILSYKGDSHLFLTLAIVSLDKWLHVRRGILCDSQMI